MYHAALVFIIYWYLWGRNIIIFKNERKKHHFRTSTFNSFLSIPQKMAGLFFSSHMTLEDLSPLLPLCLNFVLIIFSIPWPTPMSANHCCSWEALCCISHWATFCREFPPLKTCSSGLCVGCFAEGIKRDALGKNFAVSFQTVFVDVGSHHRLSADLRDLQLYESRGRC